MASRRTMKTLEPRLLAACALLALASLQGCGSVSGARKELINPPELHDTSKYYTHVVASRAPRTVVVSGQIAVNQRREILGRGDLRTQASRAFKNLKTALAAAGATPADVVKINVYIVDYKQADLAILEEAISECFGENRGFASTVVGVKALALDGLLIEVEATAMTK